MNPRIEAVDLTLERGLWMVASTSSSVYYCDTRRALLGGRGTPRFMRARGDGPTEHGHADDEWRPLLALFSIPIMEVDGYEAIDPNIPVVENVIRVGSRHKYWYDLNPIFDGWWMGRTVQRIERLDRMPPVGERTKPETGGRQW